MRTMRTFIVAALAAAALAIPVSVSAQSSAPSCTLSNMVLGGAPVVQIDANGMHHSANYEIDWVEPLITQTEYMWSTSKGQLQDTVMNDQGSGTYTADLYYVGNQGRVWEAACSLNV